MNALSINETETELLTGISYVRSRLGKTVKNYEILGFKTFSMMTKQFLTEIERENFEEKLKTTENVPETLSRMKFFNDFYKVFINPVILSDVMKIEA